MLVKVKVELLGDLEVLLVHAHADLPDLALGPVVDPAIIEHELHVRHKVLNALILLLLQLRLDCAEVHRVFDQVWVVWDLQRDVVDRIRKDVSFLVLLEHYEHALGRLFPLVKDGGTLGNLRYGDLAGRSNVLALLSQLEVGGKFWILALEVLELRISHRRVKASFTQHRKHAPPRKLPFVFSRLRLHRQLRLLDWSCLCWLASISDHNATILEDHAQDFDSIVFFGPMSRSHPFLVLSAQISALVNEEFDHLVTIVLNCVINWSLIFSVRDVELGSKLDQLLHNFDVPFTRCIEDRGLSVLVLHIHQVYSIVAQELNS